MMETISIPWAPCFCDPWLGVAHFDSITVRADPITSARPDRILPTIIDEQIALCRYVASREKKCKGLKAIDLGSGSGVLSIYAAMLGMNVKGVDVVDRAIDYANYNKSQHNPSVVSANGGSVEFVPDNVCELEEAGVYDVVVMNPPFSPTIGIDAPKCTNGGASGQDVFQQFLAKAAQLLRPGGRCYTVHLMETDKEGNTIDDFPACAIAEKWSSVLKVSIRPERILAADFLARAYSWIKPIPPTSLLAKAILRASERDIHYDMALIEAHRAAPGERPLPVVLGNLSPVDHTFSSDWSDRILLHNQVLLNSTWQKDAKKEAYLHNESRIPSGSVLLQTTSIGHSTPSTPDLNEPSVLSRPLKMLHEWLVQNKVLTDDEDAGVTALMIEAVPWSHRGLSGVESETTLWSRGADQADVDAALKSILAQITTFNTENRSIFRHRGLDTPPYSHWEISAVRNLSTNPEGHPLLPPPRVQEVNHVPTASVSIKAATYAHPLQDFTITRNTNEDSDPSHFEAHLRQALSDFTRIICTSRLLSNRKSTCHFAFLPLPLPAPEDKNDGEVGSIYVYAWSQSPWTPFLEARILDTARVASAFYGHKYTTDSAKRIRILDKGTILQSATHELEKLLEHIKEGLTPEVSCMIRQALRMHLELDPFSSDCPAYWLSDIYNIEHLALSITREAFVLCAILTSSEASRVTTSSARSINDMSELATSSVNLANKADWSLHANAWEETVPDEPDQASFPGGMYLRSAIAASVRNAFKNTPQAPGGTTSLPHISVSPGHLLIGHERFPALLIDNQFECARVIAEGMESKYENKIGKNRPGTAKVLAYYAQQLVKHECIHLAEPRAFLFPLRRAQDTPASEGLVTVAWRSVIPLPTKRLP